MSLFNVFKKKEVKETNNFTPQILKTTNVSNSLNEIAQKYNLTLSSLDFDILEVDTYVKLHKETDFVLADSEVLDMIKNKNLLLDVELEIKQSYEIKIRKIRFDNNFELLGKMVVDKHITHSTYIVSPASLLFYDDDLENKLLEELRKKKLKSGMIIDTNLFDSSLKDEIRKLVAKIRILGSLEDDFEIELCKGKKPIPAVNLEVKKEYKKHETENSRIKDLIYPIKKDDVLIEIIKPKQGQNGRSCRGVLLKVKELKDVEIPEFVINDDITKRENELRITYKANKNGYVYINQNVISIKDELEVNQISLKTGNITGAHESDVKLEVKESGVLKEAIRDGMKVETTELVVKGNVGNGAKIKAKILEIDGQTHKGSKILAQNAEINAHKGYLKANTALINRLEGGIVEAKTVHITQAISGKIIAKEIKIDILGSHLTLIASDLIEINDLRGSENNLIIDEAMVMNKEDYIANLEEEYKKLVIVLKHHKEKYLSNKRIIMKNKETIDLIKQKIKHSKENNLIIESKYIQKIKKFNDFVKNTRSIEDKIKEVIEKQEHIKSELNNTQNGIFLAKIISHNGFNQFNRIEFRLTEPPIKLTYDTKETDTLKNLFFLKDYGEMEYKIIGENL